MEVVLLWLDDLDDLFFGLIQIWERVRHYVLGSSLVAALLPHVADALPLTPLDFVQISLAGTVTWTGLCALSLLLDRRAVRLLA
jgi:hypothetical protein